MSAISDQPGTVKFVHTYGVGLHSGDARPDVHDPRWQQRQVDGFVDFAVLAEELGYDGITLTEHHRRPPRRAGGLRQDRAGHGHARTGANLMVERFVAIGETEAQAEQNLDRLARAFRTFLALYIAGGGRVIPETDAEFHVEVITGRKSRLVIAVGSTPDQVIDETGARRLLVETFSREEARLFAREVIPALKERNATASA